VSRPMGDVPFLCRLGLHGQWYSDATMCLDGERFISALRCGRCGKWRDPIAGAMVDRERASWEKPTDG
jgi:hypothetical protein